MSTECVVCRYLAEDPRGKSLVPNPSIENISSILQCVSDRLSNGERLLKPLVDFLRSLTSNDLQGVRYHSHCRKKVVHVHKVKVTNNRKSIDDSDGPSSAKRGRPSKSDASKNPIRLTRNTAHKTKEKICVFSPCTWEGEDLHRVESEPRGRKLIDIKNYTTDDKVRTCLCTLVEPGDASSQEIWYHKNCIVYAERTCRIDDDVNNKRYSIHHKLVDLEFVASVKLSLADGEVLNMSDLNKKYICMLIEHGIPETSDNNKKYIKDLLTKCIENINFIRLPRRNESENLLLNGTISGAIDSFVDQYSNWDSDLIRVTKMMRKELLDTRKKWKFSGKLNENIRNLPIPEFFLQQLLFGAHTLDVNGKRVIQIQQTVDMAIQILMQNVRTDRQTEYSSKTDAGFVQKSQTSLSIGLPLTIHNRIRDKSLVSLLSDMHIGSSYKTIMDIEKRVETAIVHEMSVTLISSKKM